MIAVNVWGSGKLRLYGVLIGMAVGYGLSLAAGLFGAEQLQSLARSPWVALPWIEGMTQIAFRWSLLPAFLIVSVTGALKSMGNLIMCEKVNDADWREPDLDRIGGGLMADAMAVTVSGLIGGMASDTSASNVALSSATGATSRHIGFAAGGLFILLGFSPKISGLLSVMPTPVMGAILVFVTSFMILSGMQIILGAGVDSRKTFVVGTALVFGLSLDILPGAYAGVSRLAAAPVRLLADARHGRRRGAQPAAARPPESGGQACRGLGVTPMPSQDAVQRWFDRTYATEGLAYLRPAAFYSIFLEYLGVGAGERLLDIGCGPGLLTGEALDAGAKGYGIDLSLTALALARQRTSRSLFACANAEALPFRDGCLEHLTCIGTLEHFLSAERALGEMRRVLAASGRACIMVPNSRAPKWLLEAKLLRRHDENSHERAATLEEWRELITRCSFAIEWLGRDEWPRRAERPPSRTDGASGRAGTATRHLWPLRYATQYVFLLRPVP